MPRVVLSRQIPPVRRRQERVLALSVCGDELWPYASEDPGAHSADNGREGMMWGWLKDAAKQFIHMGANYLQNRAFILSLFNMAPQQAYWVLKQKIEAMDDETLRSFSVTLSGMIGEAQQAAQQASDASSWGTSFEDRTAQFMAEAQAGFPSSQQVNQAQMYVQGLHTIANYAQQFYQEKLTRAAQQPPVVTAQPARAEVDTGQLERMIDSLVHTGKLDPTMVQQLADLNDEAAIDRVIAKFKALGADEGASPPLSIAEYYRPGTVKYQLQWPLPATLPLPVPFDQLDRETQFYVLFGEWSRRELEANQALFSGDTAGAQTIFSECLARAEQLDVGELQARSYEGFVRVAQKRGDRHAERQWLDAALAARKAG